MIKTIPSAIVFHYWKDSYRYRQVIILLFMWDIFVFPGLHTCFDSPHLYSLASLVVHFDIALHYKQNCFLTRIIELFTSLRQLRFIAQKQKSFMMNDIFHILRNAL